MPGPRPNLSHPQYRPDIDGLRAIAVFAVVLFHAFPSYAKGGFIGVDVFFVISGYLISCILIENFNKSTFSLKEFYSRRIRRIFPALTLVLVFCLTFGWFVLLAEEYKQLGKYTLAASVFVSNFALWSDAGYFDNSAETKPLLHLWSLGIEEQFYIVWPLALFFLWNRKLNYITITILVAVTSFTLNLLGSREDSAATFFSPQTRFWELLSGTLLAYQKFKCIINKPTKGETSGFAATLFLLKPNCNNMAIIANTISITGVCLLIFGFSFISKNSTYPGSLALIPIIGSVLLITAGQKAWINRHLLSNKVAVWFGLISFPLYLWHWPLLSFARIIEGETPSREIRIFLVLASIALAYITYAIVEQPFRNNRVKIGTWLLIILMALCGLCGYTIVAFNGFQFRLEKFIKISNASGEWEYPGEMSKFDFQNRLFYKIESNNDTTTLFIGDSNMEHYYSRIHELLTLNPNTSNSAVFATGEGCLPIPGSPFDAPHNHCFGLMETAYTYARSTSKVKKVVIGGLWVQYLGEGAALEGEFGHKSKNYNDALIRLSKYISQLINDGKHVYLVLNIPRHNALDPKSMASRKISNFPQILSINDSALEVEQLGSDFRLINEDIKRVGIAAGATIIEPQKHLCDLRKCPKVDKNDEPLYKDAGHLRPSYVRHGASFIDETVLK